MIPKLYDPSLWHRYGNGRASQLASFERYLGELILDSWPWDGEPCIWQIERVFEGRTFVGDRLHVHDFSKIYQFLLRHEFTIWIGSSLIDVQKIFASDKLKDLWFAPSGFLFMSKISPPHHPPCCDISSVTKIYNRQTGDIVVHAEAEKMVRSIVRRYRRKYPTNG